MEKVICPKCGNEGYTASPEISKCGCGYRFVPEFDKGRIDLPKQDEHYNEDKDQRIHSIDKIIAQARSALKLFLEALMDKELNQKVSATWHERSKQRQDYRNGFRYKNAGSSKLGIIKDLKVPRSRHPFGKFETLNKYKKQEASLGLEFLKECLLGPGASRLGEVAAEVFSGLFQENIISRIIGGVRNKINESRGQAVDDKYEYLYLDAMWVISPTGRENTMKPVFLVMGADKDGAHDILGVKLAEKETTGEWIDYLQEIRHRGLAGKNLKLIVYGSLFELGDVLDGIYPSVLNQRCLNYKFSRILDERNLKDPTHREDIGEELAYIFKGKNKKEITCEIEDFVKKWEAQEPRVTWLVNEDIDRIMNYCSLPNGEEASLRTTKITREAFDEISQTMNLVACSRSIGAKKEEFF